MSYKKIETGNAEPWMFEEMGDLEGIYKSRHNAKSKKGKPLVFHEFETLDNPRRVAVLGGTVLNRQLDMIESDTRVLIKYTGEVEGKNGTYKNYEVQIWEED